MRADAAHGPAITVGADARVTPVGAWLRKSKIDELPQLINVARGEMSLVGPRPEVPLYVDLWPAPLRDEILSVRPGLTDPASIKFRNESEILAGYPDPDRAYREIVMPEKLRLYAEYVRTQSLVGDLRLIGRTIAAVVGI
jgi:lipopolysaccharide/colanic/teichoic acid biosynthesis glycosyltransferase